MCNSINKYVKLKENMAALPQLATDFAYLVRTTNKSELRKH